MLVGWVMLTNWKKFYFGSLFIKFCLLEVGVLLIVLINYLIEIKGKYCSY